MKLEFEGMTFHVANVQELDDVISLLEKRRREKQTLKELVQDVAVEETEAQRVRKLFCSVNPNARRFMLELLSFPEGVSGDVFSEKSGIKSEKFGGIMGGIQKLGEREKISREELIVSTQKTEGTTRLRWLVPGRLLLQYQFELRKVAKEDGGKLISMGA